MRLYHIVSILILLFVTVAIPSLAQDNEDSLIKLAVLVVWENTPNAQTTQNADSSQPPSLSMADHQDAMETVSLYLSEILDVDAQVIKTRVGGHNKRHFKTNTIGTLQLNRTVRAPLRRSHGQGIRVGQRRTLGVENEQKEEFIRLLDSDPLGVLRQSDHLNVLKNRINGRSNNRSGRRQMLGFEGRAAPPTVSRIYMQPEVRFLAHGGNKRFPTRAYANGKGAADYIKSQTASRWNLDRINQPSLPLDGNVALPSYFFPLPSPAYIYMSDTVVYLNHTDFGGRASEVVNVYPDEVGICESHGSHTTGVAGGTISGVNYLSTLLSVRVLNCDGYGYTSDIITGLSLMLQDCIARGGGTTSGIVLNMSWGGPGDASNYTYDPMYVILEEIRTTCDAVLVAAAGNSDMETCETLPAGYPNVLAIGATDINDNFASFSDYGPCDGLNAPGVNILSVGIASPTSFVTMSGTSDSSPLAAGVASLHMSRRPQTWAQDHPGALFADNVISKILSDSNGARVTRRVPDSSTTTRILQVTNSPIETAGILSPVAPSPVSPNSIQTSDAESDNKKTTSWLLWYASFCLVVCLIKLFV